MKAQRVRQLALTSYSATLMTIILWYFVFAPPHFVTSTILSLLYCGILLIPAYGLIKNKPNAYLWSSYLMLLYFMHAVVETYANHDHRSLAIAELISSFIYFISASLCARYKLQGLL